MGQKVLEKNGKILAHIFYRKNFTSFKEIPYLLDVILFGSFEYNSELYDYTLIFKER